MYYVPNNKLRYLMELPYSFVLGLLKSINFLLCAYILSPKEQ